MKIKDILKEQKDDDILVIDVEATCWNNPEEMAKNKNEVIEIGYSKKGNNGTIYIKPEFSKVSSFCTELTGITQDFLDKNGVSPQEAYKKLNTLFNGETTWASYGYYDHSILKTMSSSYKGVSIKFPPNHINIRLMAAKKIYKSDEPKAAPSNPKEVIEKLGGKFVGRNHSGKDDAKNIALLLNKLEKI